MKKIFLLSFIFFTPCLFSQSFAYVRECLAVQKGDFKKAHALLSSLVTNTPDNPELLYDAGVSAFELKNFEQARAYFKNSAENKNASNLLKQDAYFNWANTSVELKKLQDAIKNYEKVLELNSEHEQAKHNLEVVKKMQQQEQQKQEPQEKNKDDEQESQNDKQGENKSDDQQSDQQQNDERDQSESDKQEKQEKGEQERGEQKDQQSGQDEKPEREDNRSDNSESEKNEQEQKDQGQHDESPEKNESQSEDQDTQQEQQEQSGQGPANQEPNQYDQEVMQVLEFMEKKEAEAQKKMMAAQVKQATGAYDKNQNNY